MDSGEVGEAHARRGNSRVRRLDIRLDHLVTVTAARVGDSDGGGERVARSDGGLAENEVGVGEASAAVCYSLLCHKQQTISVHTP